MKWHVVALICFLYQIECEVNDINICNTSNFTRHSNQASRLPGQVPVLAGAVVPNEEIRGGQ